jgi:serine/threonine protein kinase
VKPANLLVRGDGVVKVTDFGVAQAAGKQPCRHSDAVVGTVGYLAPEQATGQPTTPTSDLNALG